MPKKKSKRIEAYTQPEKPYNVTVIYNEYEEIVRERYEDDKWDSGEQRVCFNIATEQERGWPTCVEVAFDPEDHLGENVFVVVVRYDTGDTFGRTYDTWTITDIVLTMEEADEICKAILYDKYGKYNAWQGYFEKFNSVDYESHMLRI